MHFEFRSPARLDDELVVRLWVERFGTSSMQLQCEIARTEDNRVTAEGHVVLVAVDRDHLKPRPLPEELVAGLRPFSAEVLAAAMAAAAG